MKEQPPYLEVKEIVIVKSYNSKYGDDKICKCGHRYYRHFDTYEEMAPIGCKYCECYEFEPKKVKK
jgi:hypothetical protein